MEEAWTISSPSSKWNFDLLSCFVISNMVGTSHAWCWWCLNWYSPAHSQIWRSSFFDPVDFGHTPELWNHQHSILLHKCFSPTSSPNYSNIFAIKYLSASATNLPTSSSLFMIDTIWSFTSKRISISCGRVEFSFHWNDVAKSKRG